MPSKFFSICFNCLSTPLNDWSESDFNLPVDPSDELLYDNDTICELLTCLDVSKSSGPDGISAKMLKHTAIGISLFNLSIKNGKVPRDWKLSTVVPIPKSGRAHSPNNYRPISLLSVLNKVLEKHIHTLIFNNLKQHYPLSDCQWGFQNGRSTVSALLSTIHHWLQLMESGMDVCAVFLDYRKAFNSVPHAPLVKKLQDIGLHTNLLAWVFDYLTLRKQQVVADGATSSQVPVASELLRAQCWDPYSFLSTSMVLQKSVYLHILIAYSTPMMFCYIAVYHNQRKTFSQYNQILMS